MIIDLILDRKDGTPYVPKQFYNAVMKYESVLTIGRGISRAMDSGSEEDIRRELSDYVIGNGYNPEITDYINSVKWSE